MQCKKAIQDKEAILVWLIAVSLLMLFCLFIADDKNNDNKQKPNAEQIQIGIIGSQLHTTRF